MIFKGLYIISFIFLLIALLYSYFAFKAEQKDFSLSISTNVSFEERQLIESSVTYLLKKCPNLAEYSHYFESVNASMNDVSIYHMGEKLGWQRVLYFSPKVSNDAPWPYSGHTLHYYVSININPGVVMKTEIGQKLCPISHSLNGNDVFLRDNGDLWSDW